VGYVDAASLSYVLADSRELFSDVSFRVGEGAKVALIGANGTGKTTLLRIVAGDLTPAGGNIARAGGLGVMRQFIGSIRDSTTVRELLLSLAPAAIRSAGEGLDRAELAMMDTDDEPTQLRYADALAAWGDAGGYAAEVLWDTVTVAALGVPYDRAGYRAVRTLSGGEQKRLALEALLRGPDEVLLLDEPDNYLDVPGKRWLEERLAESAKTVLFVSHDRELLARTATRVVTLEGGTAWTHGGGFATYHQARTDRHEHLDELRRRWDEEHAKIKALVVMYRQKASYNSDMASRLQAAVTRLRKFEEAGPPEERPREQQVVMRLRGGRTGKRAVVCRQLELTGLMKPFDLEVFYNERVAVLGSNGSGKSHFLGCSRAAAARGRARSTAPRSRRSPTPGSPGWGRGCCRGCSPRRTTIRSSSSARWSTCCGAATTFGSASTATVRCGPCAATSSTRRAISSSAPCRAASRQGCRFCCSSWLGPRCCCWTSRPTTWTWPAPRRCRRAWSPSRARCSR